MAHEPQQLEDPLIEDESSPTAVVRKGEDLACTPTLPPSTPTTKTRRRHKSYDRSSLCRSARIANHGVLKNLGIVGNDGKCNEDAIQDYADCRVVTARRPQAFDEFKRSCLLGPCGGDCFTSLLGGFRCLFVLLVDLVKFTTGNRPFAECIISSTQQTDCVKCSM